MAGKNPGFEPQETDIPIGERREMLDILNNAHAHSRCDIQYSFLVVVSDENRKSLVDRYNVYVKPEFALRPDQAEFIFREPGGGHVLGKNEHMFVPPPDEHCDTSEVEGEPPMERWSMYVKCELDYLDEKGEYVMGHIKWGDDVQLIHTKNLDDKRLHAATKFLDWGELQKQAVKFGYVEAESKSSGKTKNKPLNKRAGNAQAQTVQP